MLQPPTDNLYKFIAISGLIIVILSIGFVWKKYEEYEGKKLAVASQVRLIKHKLDRFNLEVNQLNKRKEELEKKKKETGKPISREALDAFKEDLLTKVAPLDNTIGELLISSENAVLEIQHLDRWLRIYSWLSAVLSALGLAMIACGFYFWYVRVQRFLDRQLKVKE